MGLKSKSLGEAPARSASRLMRTLNPKASRQLNPDVLNCAIVGVRSKSIGRDDVCGIFQCLGAHDQTAAALSILLCEAFWLQILQSGAFPIAKWLFWLPSGFSEPRPVPNRQLPLAENDLFCDWEPYVARTCWARKRASWIKHCPMNHEV